MFGNFNPPWWWYLVFFLLMIPIVIPAMINGLTNMKIKPLNRIVEWYYENIIERILM